MLWIYWRDTESKKNMRIIYIYIYRKKKLEGESVVNFTSWTTSYTISIIQLHMCLDVSWFPLTQQCHGCGMSFSSPFDWKTMTRNVHSNPHFQKTTRLTTSYIYTVTVYDISCSLTCNNTLHLLRQVPELFSKVMQSMHSFGICLTLHGQVPQESVSRRRLRASSWQFEDLVTVIWPRSWRTWIPWIPWHIHLNSHSPGLWGPVRGYMFFFCVFFVWNGWMDWKKTHKNVYIYIYR